MQNHSGLQPVGRAVLVRTYEPERKKSLIEIPSVVSDKTQMLEQRAEVIECGANVWFDEPSPRAVPGDRVLITKYAGYFADGPADGKRYRIVNDRDIFAKIVEEKHDE